MLVFVSSKAGEAQLLKTSGNLFRSLYTFGDSFVDPGNNDYIETPARSNFPPYGRDFVNHMPTGRFSNGRLFPDFLAYYLGVENYQRPYLDPMLNIDEALTANAIPMSKQLEYFKQYKAKLEKKMGKKKAEEQIKKALFYINAGSDDFAFTYFGDGSGQTIRQKTYKLPDYEQFLLQLMQQFIQGLSEQGARKIAVNGLPPLGCIPVGITLLPRNSKTTSPRRNCLDYVNKVARDFNLLLQNELNAMHSNLSKLGTQITYIDFEQPLLDVIQNPDTYGLHKILEPFSKNFLGTPESLKFDLRLAMA
ncbi:hypothetical protein U1Q18_013500 [Sarracenia purpurea var. burkii]